MVIVIIFDIYEFDCEFGVYWFMEFMFLVGIVYILVIFVVLVLFSMGKIWNYVFKCFFNFIM